jgi:hypothetical protein
MERSFRLAHRHLVEASYWPLRAYFETKVSQGLVRLRVDEPLAIIETYCDGLEASVVR